MMVMTTMMTTRTTMALSPERSARHAITRRHHHTNAPRASRQHERRVRRQVAPHGLAHRAELAKGAGVLTTTSLVIAIVTSVVIGRLTGYAVMVVMVRPEATTRVVLRARRSLEADVLDDLEDAGVQQDLVVRSFVRSFVRWLCSVQCTHARMHTCTHARMHACTHARMCTRAREHDTPNRPSHKRAPAR